MEPRVELDRTDFAFIDAAVQQGRFASHAAAIAAAVELLRAARPVPDELEEFEHRPHSGELEVWDVGVDGEPGCA